MTAEEPVWAPPDSPLRRAVDYMLACGCTISDACPEHQRRIEAAEFVRDYGDPDDWDPDR